MKQARLLLAVASLALSWGGLSEAIAHPTSYAGATSVMIESSQEMSHFTLHYSFSPRISLGTQFSRLNESASERYTLTSYTGLLLHRWNHKSFQANLYAFGGLGGTRYESKNRFSGMSGAQFDIEDRRFYFLTEYSNHIIRNHKHQHSLKARADIAPYLAEYDELNSWLILQYDFKPQKAKPHQFTPLVRFFYHNVLVETGASFQGDWLLNMMIHF